MRQIVSATMLVSLLIGMPATVDLLGEVENSLWVNDLQFVNSGTKHDLRESGGVLRIVEHKISTLEFEKLKKEIGVWEEGRNCNQKIGEHGTGLHPPTEKEWAEIVNKTYEVERIWIDEIQSPPSVDHTAKPWFPPIGDQDGEGSCVAWAVAYYMKTFQEAKEHGWDLSEAEWEGEYPTPAYQDRIFSPDFIYHLINEGVDQGSYFSTAIDLVCTIGASSWEKMPYDPTDSTSWPSEDAWREAPLYRGNSSGYEYLELDTDDDLISLKNLLASDNLALISVDGQQYCNLTSVDFWTLDNYVNASRNHANTIVGYNDEIEYLEQGEWRYGAFKIANSWGEGGWEKIPDGCYWISYEAMKQLVNRVMFYHDKIGYEPELVSSFRIDHAKRSECEIAIGIGNHSSPAATKSFTDLIDGGDHPFCSNNIVFDITEFKPLCVPTVTNQPFFMEVYDKQTVPPAHSGTYEWYSDGASYSWFRLGQTFDIPKTGATLKFWSYYEIEEDWDYGYVEVHDLDADEWCTLPGLMTVSTLPETQDNPNCPSEFEPTSYYNAGRWNAFTGFSNVMYQEEMDLTPFADHTIELYFTYWTDPFVLERGWYIDDIEIQEMGFFDNVESGPSDWTHNGWYITIPITTGIISSFSIEYYYNYSSDSLKAESASHDVPINTIDQNHVLAELILTGVHYVNVNVSEAKQMMESNSNLVILDARTQGEYIERHIENAVLIPVSELESRIGELDGEKDTLVYSRSGGRSASASQILIDNGFTDVYNMLGGIIAWRDAGYWIEIIHEGDFVIDGIQTSVIEDCTYRVQGNIYVQDWGRCTIRNTVLIIEQDFAGQHEEFYIMDAGRLKTENTIIESQFGFQFFTSNHAQVDFINVTIDAWIQCFDHSRVNILNSELSLLESTDQSKVAISCSSIKTIGLEFLLSSQVARLEGLRPGFYKYWSLHENQSTLHVLHDLTIQNTLVSSWSVGVGQDSSVAISNSEIESVRCEFYNTNVRVDGANPGFYRNWTVNTISLLNTSVTRLWHLWIEDCFAEISNTTARASLTGYTNVSISDSTISLSACDLKDGEVRCQRTTIDYLDAHASDFNVYGEIHFPSEIWISFWASTNVTRNYSVSAMSLSQNTLENVELTLFDQTDTVVWTGTIGSSGQADFNLTFTDSNYTGTFKLEAVEGNYSDAMNVSLLSDTPVLLAMRYFADLNGDGAINIVDVSIVAVAFGTKLGDTNWDEIANMDENDEINIIDVSIVAKEYGKTI